MLSCSLFCQGTVARLCSNEIFHLLSSWRKRLLASSMERWIWREAAHDLRTRAGCTHGTAFDQMSFCNDGFPFQPLRKAGLGITSWACATKHRSQSAFFLACLNGSRFQKTAFCARSCIAGLPSKCHEPSLAFDQTNQPASSNKGRERKG